MDALFHYTTAAGLLGILGSSTLWATDLRFLNDAQEAAYARDLFVEAVRSAEHPALRAGQTPREEGVEDYNAYKQLVEAELNSADFPVYVTCFCESGDLLSQWRAYGSDHGYAIEIKAQVVKTAAQQMTEYVPVELTQVRYGRDAAADIVATAMREMANDTNIGHVGVHAHWMALQLTAMLAHIKHPGFQEEREWRVVAAFESENPKVANFRSTPMAMVPYIEINLPKEAIVTIRVGPGRHVDVREAGVRRLLRKLDCDVPLLHSEVPLRT